MPIKFRCSYCRQFLGISRAQAGGVVDCPTCGRSIRVPMLDGTVEPMPGPERNIADTHLTRALDELARLAEAPIQHLVPMKSEAGGADDNEAENQIPQPLPEPIPIEVPLPPTPVVVQPPANISLNGNSANGAGEANLLEELAALSASLPSNHKVEVVREELPVQRPRESPTSLRLSFIMVAVFLSGLLTERFIHILENLNRPRTSTTSSEKPETAEGQLTGRITFKTKEGESSPDKGARVLVFPQKRQGEVKLPVVGFRPSDSSQDQLVADAELKALGGGAAVVNEHGRYRLTIDAGTYHLLIISHYQPSDGAAANPALSKLLAEYFDKPDELIGKVEYQFVPLRIKGTGDILDHSF